MPTQPEPPPGESFAAVKAWNLMGGQLDMAALSFMCELLGVHDVESFFIDLVMIREHMKAE